MIRQNKFILFLMVAIMVDMGCTPHPSDLSDSIVKELPRSTLLLSYRGGKVEASDVHAQIAPTLEKLRNETIQLYHHHAEALALSRILEARARSEGFKSGAEYKESKLSKIDIQDSDISNFIKRNHLSPKARAEAKKFLQVQAGLAFEEELKKTLLKEADLSWKLMGAIPPIQEKAEGR